MRLIQCVTGHDVDKMAVAEKWAEVGPKLLKAVQFAHKYAVMKAQKGEALPSQLVNVLFEARELGETIK